MPANRMFALTQPLNKDGDTLRQVEQLCWRDLAPPAEPLPAPEAHRALLTDREAVVECELESEGM